jgi:hypothetical protein
MRENAHVAQAGLLEQPEELTAEPGSGHGGIQGFRDPARQNGIGRVDDGRIGVEIKDEHSSAEPQRSWPDWHLFRRLVQLGRPPG